MHSQILRKRFLNGHLISYAKTSWLCSHLLKFQLSSPWSLGCSLAEPSISISLQMSSVWLPPSSKVFDLVCTMMPMNNKILNNCVCACVCVCLCMCMCLLCYTHTYNISLCKTTYSSGTKLFQIVGFAFYQFSSLQEEFPTLYSVPSSPCYNYNKNYIIKLYFLQTIYYISCMILHCVL